MRWSVESFSSSRIRVLFAAAAVPLALGSVKPGGPRAAAPGNTVMSLARQISTCDGIGCSGGVYFCGYCAGGSCYTCDGITFVRKLK